MANAENDDTEVGPSMAGTVNIKTQFNDGQDHFTPIVEQIRVREKENMESAKRLRDMIAKDRKKCIEMKFALQSKFQTSESLSKENETIRDALKDALNELRNLAPQQSTQERESPKREIRFDREENYDPILQRLKRIMNDLLADIRRKEDYLARHPPEKGSDDRENTGSLNDLKKALDHYRRILEDLIKLEKEWVNKLSTLIKDHVKLDSDKKLSNFHKGTLRTIDLIDDCIALELTLDKLKAKKKELEAKKKLHEIVARRLHERKPLDFLPSKIRREFEQIAKKRGKTDPLSAVDEDLAKYLQTLYDWGCKEYKRGDQLLKELMRQVAEAKDKAKRDENAGKLNRSSKSEELQKTAVELAKLDAENKNLRAQLEQSRRGMDTRSSKTRQISQEIKLLLETNKARDVSLGRNRDRIEKDIENENEKRRENEFTINKLDRTKARQEDEMSKLDQQIRDLKFKALQRVPNRQKSEDRLEHLRRQRDELKTKLAQKPPYKSQNVKRPLKQFNDAQKRSIEKVKNALQSKNDKLRDIQRDCDELRRRMKQYESEMNSIKTDLDRKFGINDMLRSRLKEENATLANLKGELKKQQDITLETGRKQIKNRNRPNTSSPAIFENKYETHFSTADQKPN